MKLGKIRTALRDDVVSQRHIDTYESARPREDALREHPTIIAALAVLNDESETRYPEREAITRALIREYQRGRGAFWASVLTLAFMPMLVRLRCRLVSEHAGSDELNQRVVATFLETVATISLDDRPTRIAMYLRQQTQRGIFARLDGERRERAQHDALCEHAANDPEFSVFEEPHGDGLVDEEEVSDLSESLREIVGDRLPCERVDVVVATYVAGEKLAAFVARTATTDAGESHRRVYQRLKRERLRSCDTIRPLLVERLSLFEAPDALLSLSARS
jgi:hypothetical protein